MAGDFRIRPAEASEVSLVLSFIRELAEFEQALDRAAATEELLRESLFSEPRRAEAILGHLGEEPVSFAVFYHSFSTYLGRHCLHLEDLYVRPGHRGKGLGQQMLAYLARTARGRHCALMEWSSLAWNESAKRFYLRIGAKGEDRSMFRLSGEALQKLANREE